MTNPVMIAFFMVSTILSIDGQKREERHTHSYLHVTLLSHILSGCKLGIGGINVRCGRRYQA